MNVNEIHSIYKESKLFRCGIELAKDELPKYFQHFPWGCCGNICLLLGHYLQNKGLGTYFYILREYKKQSHAWLAREKIYVDITADQFLEIKRKIIIDYKSKLEWYKKYHGEYQNIADFSIYKDKRTPVEMELCYNIIIKKLELIQQNTDV